MLNITCLFLHFYKFKSARLYHLKAKSELAAAKMKLKAKINKIIFIFKNIWILTLKHVSFVILQLKII